MVLKKLESKVGERQIVRDNLAALISHSPPSPLGGFFGTTRVNDLASDLSDVYTLVHFLDEDSIKVIVIQDGSDQTRQIDLVYAEYKPRNRHHKDIPSSLASASWCNYLNVMLI